MVCVVGVHTSYFRGHYRPASLCVPASSQIRKTYKSRFVSPPQWPIEIQTETLEIWAISRQGAEQGEFFAFHAINTWTDLFFQSRVLALNFKAYNSQFSEKYWTIVSFFIIILNAHLNESSIFRNFRKLDTMGLKMPSVRIKKTCVSITSGQRNFMMIDNGKGTKYLLSSQK